MCAAKQRGTTEFLQQKQASLGSFQWFCPWDQESWLIYPGPTFSLSCF